MLPNGRTLPPMAASWFRLVATPSGVVRMLLVVPDALPLIHAIRLAPLHVGLQIVRPDNVEDALNGGQFDVVVSDQIGVLMRSQELRPATPRVWVLDEAPVSPEAWACPHHILPWKASLSDLTAVMDSCLDGNGVPDIALPKDCNGDLPKIASEALHVLDVLDDPTSNVAQIRDVMQLDAMMVAQVLKMVNSPYFNLPRRVASLDHAIALLGVNQLRSAVLAGACFGAIGGVEQRHVSRISQDGLMAMGLVRRIAGAHAEAAVTAAILMDIGKLLMMKTDPDYPKLVEACRQAGVSLTDMEQSHYGFTHAYLGARLLHHWRLPAEVIHAVAYSHTGYPLPSRPQSPRMLLFIVGELIAASDQGRPVRLNPQWLAQTGWADSVDDWQQDIADLEMLAVAC